MSSRVISPRPGRYLLDGLTGPVEMRRRIYKSDGKARAGRQFDLNGNPEAPLHKERVDDDINRMSHEYGRMIPGEGNGRMHS